MAEDNDFEDECVEKCPKCGQRITHLEGWGEDKVVISLKKLIEWREKHGAFCDFVGLSELDNLIRTVDPEYCNPPQRAMGYTKFSEIGKDSLFKVAKK